MSARGSSGASFGAALRRFRERAGLTQQELAERAELTPHAVSALERGKRNRPYPHTVRSLADALGLHEDDRATLLDSVPRRGKQPTAGPRPAGLVVPPTTLYGRGDDITRVVELVRSGVRLVTLTGPGGVGKTRVVAALSDVLRADFDDVVQVSLAPVLDATAVMATLGRALGLTGTDGAAAYDVVVAHLRDLELLLVLDNFEHLLSAAPDVGRLVASCASVTVLVTSRSPLRVRAEHEYVVEPLGLPARDADSLDGLSASPAGALVRDRLSAVSRQPVDVAACVELCHRLAGLPLAIELATAQLRMLSPRDLLARLDETLTTSGARDLPERQRTMRTTLDWSYGLLDRGDQDLFTLLGAFRGGATLEAVEAVAGEPVLEPLGRLVEHSLVVMRDGRFTMLEPIAQYARSLLVGDRAKRIVRAHAAYYLDLVTEAAGGYERADQVSWLARIEANEANVLVAVERSLDGGDSATAARLTWFMWLYWWLRGQVTIGRRLAEQCLATELPAWERARANLAAATMSYAGGDHAAAAGYWAEADRVAADLDDPEIRSKAIAGVGLAALAEGDLASAELGFRAALHFAAQQQGSTWMASLVHVWLGTLHLLRGRPQDAVPDIDRGLQLARERGDRLSTYVALYNLSQAALALGDPATARAHLEEGVALSQEIQDLANLAYFVETLAVVESQEGHHAQVATLLGATVGLRQTVGADVYAYYLPDESMRAAADQAAREALGADAYDDAFEQGRELGLSEVVTLATPPSGRR